MVITKFTIYGERCSGTNYIEDLMLLNFDIEVTWEYGWKHFFGFQDEKLKNSDDTLFICIVRDIHKWINSMYKTMYHLPIRYQTSLPKDVKINKFLNSEFWSFNDNNGNRDLSKEIMEDRNIYTGQRYTNIFELRHTKIKFLIEDLPTKVNNYIFIRYEDLIDDFNNTMNLIKNIGLKLKNPNIFPINSTNYLKNSKIKFVPDKLIIIPRNLVLQNKNLIKYYEEKLGYI